MPEMVLMKLKPVKKLAKMVKVLADCPGWSRHECAKGDSDEVPLAAMPNGFLALYIGDERRRFVVPVAFLSHPLFRMLLEKAYNEYGFEQSNGLAVPCTVSMFQEVLSAVECCYGQFDIERLMEEFGWLEHNKEKIFGSL